MAYTVLARRYRSNTFDEVVGQNHIAQTLKKAIQSGRIAHAYLFCGTRGTGKTSTARILAKCLNCQSADHAVTEPCNQCDSCRSIAKGDDIDVIEIDAASNTGVDNVRDIIIGTAYNMPARSRFKVFIIDEVHMLSKQAFNALLKTLEEPPSHVKFILATTEPEKVLPTILSRCQRYDFRNIPTREIAGHLKSICKTEQIEADEDALLLVAKAGAGSMRDSLSLLDRLLSIGETRLTVDLLEQLLGLPKSQLIFDIAAAIGGGNVQSVLSQADSIIANGLAVDTLIVSLIDHLRNLMLLRTCGAKSDLVEVPGLSLVDLGKQAELFDPAALSQDIVILEELRRHVRQSQAGRALLDATLVRMTLADQFSSLSELVERAAGGVSAGGAGQKKKFELGEGALPLGGDGERSTFNAQRSTFKVEAAPVAQAMADVDSSLRHSTFDVQRSTFAFPSGVDAASQETKDEHRTSNVEHRTSKEGSEETTVPVDAAPVTEDEDDSLPAPGRVWDGPTESLGAMMAKHVSSIKPEPSNVSPVQSGDLSVKWKAMIALLAEQGPALGGLLQNGQFVGIEDGRAVIRYASQHETFVKLLERNGKKDLVRDALSKVMDQPLGVRFEICDDTTPVAKAPVVSLGNESRRAAPAATAVHAVVNTPVITSVPDTSNVVRLTDEMRSNLYKNDPLIRAVVDQLGGSIIKIEE
jgi:DNA polymerase III subunit gamma/tau